MPNVGLYPPLPFPSITIGHVIFIVIKVDAVILWVETVELPSFNITPLMRLANINKSHKKNVHTLRSLLFIYPSYTALRERRDASVTETGRQLRDFYNTLCSGNTARLLRDSFTTDCRDRCTTVVQCPHDLLDGSRTCTRPPRLSYDSLTTLPRPLRDSQASWGSHGPVTRFTYAPVNDARRLHDRCVNKIVGVQRWGIFLDVDSFLHFSLCPLWLSRVTTLLFSFFREPKHHTIKGF